MVSQLNIFVIYTSEDTSVTHSILQHLEPFEEDSNLTIWNDNPVHNEQLWKPKNESRLNQTDLFLLFASDAFMHSHFIQQLEFKMVIDRYKEGKSKVIPIIIDKCPWDIDFRSDDYNFNLNELGVLPKGGKPLKEWDSSEQVYKDVANSIKEVIAALKEDAVQEESKIDENSRVGGSKSEDQIELRFNEEKETKSNEEEEESLQEKAETQRIAKEQLRRAEVEAKQRAEEKERLHKEAEAKQRAENQGLKEEAELKRKALEKQELQKEMATKRIAGGEKTQSETIASDTKVEEDQNIANANTKKRVRRGILIAVLAVAGIWTFSKFNTNPKEEPTAIPETAIDSIVEKKTTIDSMPEEKTLSKLEVGSFYEDGMVFTIDSDNKNGKIVHLEDVGPMTWENAMQIHEQLGDGWRLPTFNELLVLHKTVGQGASNTAEFSNGLYWSATDYDQYQARLLRFRDANTSYHYNKVAEHRKYNVRAIRDFSR